MSKSDAQRRSDLEAAKVQYRRRTRAMLTMDEIAALYGLTKPAMHNLHKTIPDFPESVDKKGNAFFYPAYKVVVALLAYVRRKERAERDSARAFNDIVAPARAAEDDQGPLLTAGEQLKAYELRQKIIEEELDHGTLHRGDHCAAVSDKVFSEISRTFGSNLADTIDPNGKWPPELRAELDTAGEALVLRCFVHMKHMLGGEVDGADKSDADHQAPRPTRPPAARRRAGKVGKARKG